MGRTRPTTTTRSFDDDRPFLDASGEPAWGDSHEKSNNHNGNGDGNGNGRNGAGSSSSSSSSRHSSEPEVDFVAERTARRFRVRVTVLIALLIVAVDLPSVLFGTSLVRILESIYCHQHYDPLGGSERVELDANGRIPEHLCKIEEVQSELSSLRGWATFWSHLPGLFLAIPFGMLADRYGRKWLFLVNIVSMQGRSIWIYIVCSFPHVFPLKMIWLEAILAIFGGGGMVATALLFVILSDVTPTASMSSTFFRLGAANMACFTVGPPIAAAIMKKDPWLSFTLGLCLQALAIPVALFLPETLGAKKPGEPDKDSNPPSPVSTPTVMSEKVRDIRERSGRIVSFIKDNAGFMAKDWRIIFLSATYPIRMTMGSLDGQIMQYVPQRYHWTMANTTNLQALQSGVAMLVLILILPGLSSYLLKRRGFSSNRKDVLLTRLGFACYGIGILVTGFAPTILFFILGMMITTFASGAGAAIRALLTSWVQQNEVARLYTALGIIETIGSMGGGPIISALYNAGLSAHTKGAGDIVLGLPWIVTGVILSGLAIATACLKFDKAGEDGSPDSAIHEKIDDDDDGDGEDGEDNGFTLGRTRTRRMRTRKNRHGEDLVLRDLGHGVGFAQAETASTVPLTPTVARKSRTYAR